MLVISESKNNFEREFPSIGEFFSQIKTKRSSQRPPASVGVNSKVLFDLFL